MVDYDKEYKQRMKQEDLYKQLKLRHEMKAFRKSLNYSLPHYDGPGVIPLSAKAPLNKIPETKKSITTSPTSRLSKFFLLIRYRLVIRNTEVLLTSFF